MKLSFIVKISSYNYYSAILSSPLFDVTPRRQALLQKITTITPNDLHNYTKRVTKLHHTTNSHRLPQNQAYRPLTCTTISTDFLNRLNKIIQ